MNFNRDERIGVGGSMQVLLLGEESHGSKGEGAEELGYGTAEEELKRSWRSRR